MSVLNCYLFVDFSVDYYIVFPFKIILNKWPAIIIGYILIKIAPGKPFNTES